MRALESRLLLLASVLALAAACASEFEKQSQIVKLRVLGVQAEPPELVLGEGPLPKTVLTALAVEPSGALVTTQFAVCLYASGSTLTSADIDCPGASGFTLPDAGPASATLDLADPALQAAALPMFAGDGGVPTGDGGLSQALEKGLPLVLGFTASAPAFGNPDGGPPPAQGHDGQFLKGIASVTLRTASAARPPNKNPALEAVTLDGTPIAADGSTTVRAGQKVTLVPVPAGDAKEKTPDGSAEKLNFSFYATGGDVEFLRSADTTATGQPGETSIGFTAPLTAGTLRLWVVIRDGRGGLGWLERSLTVLQ